MTALVLSDRASIGQGTNLAYSPTLDRVVVVGNYLGSAHNVAYSDDHGITWVGQLLGATTVVGVCWAGSLAAFIAVDDNDVTYISTDGITWTSHTGLPPYGFFFPTDIAWGETDGKMVVVGIPYSSYYGSPPDHGVWYSSDGITWSGVAVEINAFSVCYSDALGLWVIADEFGAAWYASTAAGPWTEVPGVMVAGFGIDWLPHAGLFAMTGDGHINEAYATSPNGHVWTAGPDFSTIFADGYSMQESPDGSTWYIGGGNGPFVISSHKVAQSPAGGAAWDRGITSRDGATGLISDLLVVPGSPNEVVAAYSVPAGGFGIVSGPIIPPPRPRAPRFFEGYPWRFIFADIPTPGGALGGRTVTFANGIQSNRQIVLTLDDVSAITFDVKSDDPQVNVIDRDGYPPVAQSKRIVYAFRREGGSVPWKIRAAGIVMIVEDQADADVPLTHVTAYDPWKLLEARPCVSLSDTLPGSYGFQSWAQFGLQADQVIGNALKATIRSSTGGFAFIDAGPLYGGTSYYGGTIENPGQVLIDIQQGDSVADVWRNVCEAGFCDIVLTPIYDPVRRPGYTHELNIYLLAGQTRPSAYLAWDMLNRSASTIDRLHDATPGNFSNIVQYYVGQGGPPAPLQINNLSISDFGRYWATQFFPDQTIPSGAVVLALANQALYLSRQGQRTITLDMTPERAPIPLIDYTIGDFLPVWATDRLRVAISSSFVNYPPAAFRVSAIPILISDDGIETVQGMIVSPDWRTSPYTPVVPPILGTGASIASGASVAVSGNAVRTKARRTIYHLRKPLT